MGRVLASVMVAGVLVVGAGSYAQGQPPPAGTADVVPAPSPSPATRTAPPDDSVVLNFEGADIREVIHSLADALGINYQIDPRIQGQVTIRTTGTIAKEDLFPVFNQHPALQRHLGGEGRRHLPDHTGRRGEDEGDHPDEGR